MAEETQNEWIDISHDGENVARVTRAAFDQTWKEKGWKEHKPSASKSASSTPAQGS